MSKYPVGAKWEAINKYGDRCTITLTERYDSFEMWRWEFEYSDGSGYTSDWCGSYRKCVEESSFRLYIKGEKEPRFKRVKEEQLTIPESFSAEGYEELIKHHKEHHDHEDALVQQLAEAKHSIGVLYAEKGHELNVQALADENEKLRDKLNEVVELLRPFAELYSIYKTVCDAGMERAWNWPNMHGEYQMAYDFMKSLDG